MTKVFAKMSRWKLFPCFLFQLVLGVVYSYLTKYDDDVKFDRKNFEDTHVMIFIGFGFLMTFLHKYSYSAVGFNWFLGSLAVQWGLVCQQLMRSSGAVIPLNTKVLLEADVLSATVLITFGAVLGVAGLYQLLLITIVEIPVAAVNLFLIEKVFKASDIGGSIGIHTFGAYFGLGASLAMLKKPEPASPTYNKPNYVSDITAMIGSIFLWIYWPTFNSALAETEEERQRAFVNSFLSLASCVVTTFIISAMTNPEGKLDMVHVQNSTLAGGVAAGAVCNMLLGPGRAVYIGVLAAIVSVLGYKHLTPALARIGVSDTCGVHNLHGMPGVLSGVLSIIVAAVSTGDGAAVFAAVREDGRSSGQQAMYQAIALVTTILLAFVSGLVTGFIGRLSIFRYDSDKHYDVEYEDDHDWELTAE